MLSDASSLRGNGDWDDVDAAVEVGVNRAEMVVVHRRAAEDGRSIEYTLRTAMDEPGVLVAERAESVSAGSAHAGEGKGVGGGAGGGPVPITFRCSIGRFGDRAREERVMGYIRARLSDLRGMDWAPIRE